MSGGDLILIGSGGHARACIDVIEESGRFRIAGLVGLPEELGTEHLGYTVVGTDENLQELRSRCCYALITIGQIGTAQHRERLYRRAVELGFELPAIVARDAHVSRSAAIGNGTIVMHGAIVNAGAAVGQNCILNSRALIEHDAVVQDHCHVSTGAILNGHVRVGEGSFIGSGTTVKQGISVGRGCVIGMACSVRSDLPDGARFTGTVSHA
jgi:sugar O-acyltransferase (sialic acid O-acetyltransferase NeuD family)